MPGILTRHDLLNPSPDLEISLDDILLSVRGQQAVTSDLVGWAEGSVDDVNSIKCIIGDLVAAVGWELAGGMEVSFA